MLALAYQVKHHTAHVENRVLPIAIGTESTTVERLLYF